MNQFPENLPPLNPKKSPKIDHFLVGFFTGLIIPLLVMYWFYEFKFSAIHPKSSVFDIMTRKMLPPLLSLCVVVNLGAFYLFYWKNLNFAARGVIAATILYALLVLAMKIYFHEI